MQRLLPAILLLVLTVSLRAEEPQSAATRDVRQILGVTHVAGKYHLTDQPFLTEGADQIAALGARVIKLYLIVPPRQYPFHTDWPDVQSLVDLARTPHYRAVFAGPFSTYVLTTYSVGRGDHYWIRGIDHADAQDETDQFYRLARYLLTEYRGTGKTFVLQHWEGDWAVRGFWLIRPDGTKSWAWHALRRRLAD